MMLHAISRNEARDRGIIFAKIVYVYTMQPQYCFLADSTFYVIFCGKTMDALAIASIDLSSHTTQLVPDVQHDEQACELAFRLLRYLLTTTTVHQVAETWNP